MSEFVAGLSVRHALPAAALTRAFAGPDAFAARPPSSAGRASAGRASVDHMAADPAPAPRHFAPAAPGHRATDGWDPLVAELGDTTLDPLAAAHAAGYAEGLAAAAAAAADAQARDGTLVTGIAGAIAAGLDRAALAAALRATVLRLVGGLVGEIGVSADLLADRVDAATDLLADKAESALLRLHPDDVALVEGRLPASVFAAGDPHVARGSFVLESASTVVEDGPALWLDQLAGAIDKVPVPGC